MPVKKKPPAASPTGGKKKEAKSSKPGTASSKGDSDAAKAAFEEERKKLQAELGVAAAGRAAQEAAARALEAQLASVKQRNAQDAATAADVMASQQRQQQQAQSNARVLERQLDAAKEEVAALQRALEAALQAQSEALNTARTGADRSNEVQWLKAQLELQEGRLAAQQGAMEALRLRLHDTEAALAAERNAVASLQVKAQGRTELHFIRGAPFLVHIARQRLSGAVPPVALRPSNALGAAGRQLVLAEPDALHVLDIGSGAWWAAKASSGSRAGSASTSSTQHAAGGDQQAAGGDGPAEADPLPAGVSGRATCSVGTKLLGFGGECGGQLLSTSTTQFLHPDLQAWLPAPLPAAGAASPQPPPRTGAALAYCPRSNAAYMYGGQGEGGTCFGDLWRLDLGTMVWSQLNRLSATRPPTERTRPRTPCAHEAPPPTSCAALAVAPDGSSLWLMGGRLESGRCSSALHRYDLNMNYWVSVEPQTWTIDSREQHAMACVDRYLVVAGGLCHTASGQAIYRQDCAIYDPAANTWDLVSETAFEPATTSSEAVRVVVSVAAAEPDCCSRRSSSTAGSLGSRKQSRVASSTGIIDSRSSSSGGGASGGSGGGGPTHPFLGAGTCVFTDDGKLLLLKAGKPGTSSSSSSSMSGQLSELWTVELQLPSAIDQEQLRTMQRTTTQKDLTLQAQSVGPTWVRLSWRAPTAGRDKLLSFKLMVTNSEGRAREAYEGDQSSCEVAGLSPSAEYVFCVKALFDDASFLWSEPVMVTTKKAGSGSGGGSRSGGANGGNGAGNGGSEKLAQPSEEASAA